MFSLHRGDFKLQLPDSFHIQSSPKNFDTQNLAAASWEYENIIYYQLDKTLLDQDLDVILTSSNPACK